MVNGLEACACCYTLCTKAEFREVKSITIVKALGFHDYKSWFFKNGTFNMNVQMTT